MADINYLNPTSIAPKFDWQPKNALAGMSWVENRDDYRTLMEQQMRLQAMAEQERRIDLEHKQKDVPLKDLQRTGQIDFTRGQNPYQGQLGSTGAQAQVNTNAIAASPERKAFEIDRFKQGMDDNQWKKFTQSMGIVGSLTEQALAISKAQGPMAAQQWLTQNATQAAKAGVDLPAYIMDPNSWEPLYNAAVNTAKHAQDIGKIDAQGKNSMNVAEINGAYGLQQGRERNQTNLEIADRANQTRQAVAGARGNQFKYSLDQNINRLVNEISSIPEGEEVPLPKVRELSAAFEREYEKIATQGVAIRTMAPELQKNHLQSQRNYVMDRLKTLGITPQGGGGQSPPQSGGAGNNALKSKYGLE